MSLEQNDKTILSFFPLTPEQAERVARMIQEQQMESDFAASFPVSSEKKTVPSFSKDVNSTGKRYTDKKSGPGIIAACIIVALAFVIGIGYCVIILPGKNSSSSRPPSAASESNSKAETHLYNQADIDSNAAAEMKDVEDEEDLSTAIVWEKLGENIEWSLNDGVLILRGTGDMENFDNGIVPWLDNRKNITSVIIEQGITSIGNHAFRECTGLRSVTLPESIASIGKCAFLDCTCLSSITLPKGITSIGYSAFSDCSNLSNITLPEDITSIEYGTFWNCTSLSSVTLPEGISLIGNCAFYACTSLSSINMPKSLKSIGESAFHGCASLSNITLPEGITLISEFTFDGCTSMSNITLPDSIISIGEFSFYGCEKLRDVYYDGDLSQWSSIEFGISNDELETAVIHFSSTWEKLGDNIEWSLNDAVLTIRGSGDMEDFTETVAPWGNYSPYFSTVIIEPGIKSIGDEAFNNCTRLTSITLPDGIRAIGSSSFRSCTSLTSITLPGSITSIGDYAFYGCKNLSDIYFGGSQSRWNRIITKVNYEALENATIHFETG